jgi:hypothetical protein
MEGAGGMPKPAMPAKQAVFASSEIKVAVAGVDRGDTNVLAAFE